MAKLVDIEDAKECANIAIKWGWSLQEFRESMEQWDDTIELVRCKDCEKYKYGICTRKGMCVNVPLDFWCADGRKQCQQTIEQKEAQPAAGEAVVISDDWLRGDAPELSDNPQKLDDKNGELQPWEVLAIKAILKQPEQRWIPQEYPKRDYWVKHYKGGIYKVLNLGVKHTETDEFLVVYLDVYGQIWARPESMFYGLVEVNGEQVPRYVKIAEKEVIQLGDGTIFVRTE